MSDDRLWNMVQGQKIYRSAGLGDMMRELAHLSGAEHEHHYMYGGCPECGCFYDPEFDWQHFAGCSRATEAEPARTVNL